MTRAALVGMMARRWGRIINITSVSIKQPLDNLILSNSTRMAVAGFAKTVAREVAAYGITVNNACPGHTRTSRLEYLAQCTAKAKGKTEQEVFADWERDIPAKRLGEPKEFAALVAFLASERAGYITGTSIQVDGGSVRGI
jgi:3-oxoacyl-[acyl-carrier protein] reductase